MPKGISLHIGVNLLNKFLYGIEAKLASPENVARAMASIAAFEGYEYNILLTPQATRVNIFNKIKSIATELQAGDIFFLTFSGHGAQIDAGDDMKNEDDKKNECLCLYDGYLVDDELGDLWAVFNEGVRIVVITDCCHSRTSIKGLVQAITKKSSFVNGSPRFVSSYPAVVFKYKTVGTPKIKAGILHLSACADAQEASDGDYFSKFTAMLLSNWNYGRFVGSYEDLVASIGIKAGYSQEPALGILGNVEDYFINSKPFKI